MWSYTMYSTKMEKKLGAGGAVEGGAILVLFERPKIVNDESPESLASPVDRFLLLFTSPSAAISLPAPKLGKGAGA